MSLVNLVPWKRRKQNVPERRSNTRDRLHGDMERLFDEFFEGSLSLSLNSFDPRVDIMEGDKEIKISAELPGLEEKDIDVSLGNDVLIVGGEKKSEHETQEENCYYMERAYGSFHREISLPCNVDDDKVTATFKNGVLTVVLPKTDVSCDSRSIKISRG